MNVRGVVLDDNNKSIREGNKISCELDVANGDVVYEYVEVDFLASLSTGILSANNSNEGAGSSQSYEVKNMETDATSNKSDADMELTENIEEAHWNSKMVKLLVESYREVTEDKSNKKILRKQIWLKIANKVNNTLKSNVSGAQCDSKWKGLMKTYKKHKMLQQTTGEARRQWEHFELLDDLMNDKPQVSPVSVSSNLKGYRERVQDKAENLKENDENEPQNKIKMTEETKSCKNKKRNRIFVKTESGEDDISSEDEKKSNEKRTKYRKRQSMGKEMCLLLKKKHQDDKKLRERFVTTFEKYVHLVEQKKV